MLMVCVPVVATAVGGKTIRKSGRFTGRDITKNTERNYGQRIAAGGKKIGTITKPAYTAGNSKILKR